MVQWSFELPDKMMDFVRDWIKTRWEGQLSVRKALTLLVRKGLKSEGYNFEEIEVEQA